MAKIPSIISPTPVDKLKPQHKQVLFLQGIPESTKCAFKAACAQRGKCMRDVFIEFMREFVANTSGIIKPDCRKMENRIYKKGQLKRKLSKIPYPTEPSDDWPFT